MSHDSKRLYQEALALSVEERAALAGLLIESLDEGVDEDTEGAWASEIARRIGDVDSGKSKPVPWAEARRQIMKGLDARRARRG